MLASDEHYLDVYTPFPSHKRFVFNYIPPTLNSLLSASYYRMSHTILSELTYTYLPFEGRIMARPSCIPISPGSLLVDLFCQLPFGRRTNLLVSMMEPHWSFLPDFVVCNWPPGVPSCLPESPSCLPASPSCLPAPPSCLPASPSCLPVSASLYSSLEWCLSVHASLNQSSVTCPLVSFSSSFRPSSEYSRHSWLQYIFVCYYYIT